MRSSSLRSLYNFIGPWEWQLHILRVMRWFVWAVEVRCRWAWNWKQERESWWELSQSTNHCGWSMDRTSWVEQVSDTRTWPWQYFILFFYLIFCYVIRDIITLPRLLILMLILSPIFEGIQTAKSRNQFFLTNVVFIKWRFLCAKMGAETTYLWVCANQMESMKGLFLEQNCFGLNQVTLQLWEVPENLGCNEFKCIIFWRKSAVGKWSRRQLGFR